MKILLAALIAALLASTALAEANLTFSVAGVDPTGGTYTGTVIVEELPKEGVGSGDSFKVTWNTGGDPVVGVGVVDGRNRNVLAIGYVFNGAPGSAVMLVDDSGASASGLWAVAGATGTGTEVWTAVAAGAAAPAAAPAADGTITYDGAVECAAATAFVVGNLRVTPGSDTAKIDTYDKANSAWIIKVGELGKDKKMSERIADIRAVQAVYAADADGMGKAVPIADRCVATAPPIR